MARATKRKASPRKDAKLPPYWERLQAEAFEYVRDDDVHFEVEAFDDRDETGVLHVQFRSVGRRNRVAPFHGTADELRELIDDLSTYLDDLG